MNYNADSVMDQGLTENHNKGVDDGRKKISESGATEDERGIVACPYTTELPVAILGAKYQWARGAGLL